MLIRHSNVPEVYTLIFITRYFSFRQFWDARIIALLVSLSLDYYLEVFGRFLYKLEGLSS
jgi:hypothetical protein